MAQNECRMPGCKNEQQIDGQDLYANKFCSAECEVKYDHIKADAADAKRAAEEESRREVPKRDLPEYDGPPY